MSILADAERIIQAEWKRAKRERETIARWQHARYEGMSRGLIKQGGHESDHDRLDDDDSTGWLFPS